MKRKILITVLVFCGVIAVLLIIGAFTIGKTESERAAAEADLEQPAETDVETDEDPVISLDKVHELFLEITIDTKEEDLPALAEKYGYHLHLRRYNAGTSNRAPEENFEYELYDPSQFDSETEETYRSNTKYKNVKVSYYHANDEADTQYIMYCCYTVGLSNNLVKQIYDVETGTTEYYYYKQVTTAPARQDENWHPAESAEEALLAFLAK